MPWNLKGSYVETCSCELMCPCNLSFDHGATYEGKSGLSISRALLGRLTAMGTAGPGQPSAVRPGLGPALVAMRSRLGLVVLLFALAGVGWWTAIR